MCLGDLRFSPLLRWQFRASTVNGVAQLVPANPARVGLVVLANSTVVLRFWPSGQLGSSTIAGGFTVNSTGGPGHTLISYLDFGPLLTDSWHVETPSSVSVSFGEALAPQSVIDSIRKMGID